MFIGIGQIYGVLNYFGVNSRWGHDFFWSNWRQSNDTLLVKFATGSELYLSRYFFRSNWRGRNFFFQSRLFPDNFSTFRESFSNIWLSQDHDFIHTEWWDGPPQHICI